MRARAVVNALRVFSYACTVSWRVCLSGMVYAYISFLPWLACLLMPRIYMLVYATLNSNDKKLHHFDAWCYRSAVKETRLGEANFKSTRVVDKGKVVELGTSRTSWSTYYSFKNPTE